ncbi:MAG: hypothetical protein J5966_02025 [Lachnospiraceae bacterium]|nr:hypothetical protein [Lachnospiraceae bacterium]
MRNYQRNPMKVLINFKRTAMEMGFYCALDPDFRIKLKKAEKEIKAATTAEKAEAIAERYMHGAKGLGETFFDLYDRGLVDMSKYHYDMDTGDFLVPEK